MEQRVNEGYVITDSLHIGSTEFVIGENQTRFGTMYVTWQCRDGDNYFWGHYLTERQAAEKDLLARAGQELERNMRRQEQPKRKKEDRER